MFANRLTLMQRVFGRGLKVQSLLDVVEAPFCSLYHQSALCEWAEYSSAST